MQTPIEGLDFERLAGELRQPLRRYLRRYVGDDAAADDLLQESLVRISGGLPELAAPASVRTWAFTIATRVAADYFREPERRQRIVELDEAALPSEGARAEDERLVVDEMSCCVRRVIDSLPEDYRTALVLHDLEGLSGQQVAEVCDCSLATAKIRIHRARQRLKAALEQECAFYRDDESVFRCQPKP